MAIKIIRHRELVETVSYTLSFRRKDCPGASWGPECDKDGNIDESKMNPVIRGIWEDVKKRREAIDAGLDPEYRRPFVQEFRNHYWEPAIGRCVCGAEVALDGFTNTCDDCGRDYNSAGQELAPRSQWGDETGETAADILGPQTDETEW